MKKRSVIALGAAAMIGLGGLLVATPATADDATPDTAEAPSALKADDIKAIDSANAFEDVTDGVAVATGYDSKNNLVLLADVNEKSDEVVAYAEAAARGEAEFSRVLFTEPLVTRAATDIPGGAGYLIQSGTSLGACSIGFPAWGANGEQGFVTAGHCGTSDTADFDVYELSRPSTDPANGGSGGDVNGTGPLGDFDFVQFGGPGNTDGEDGNPTSTDIAVVEVAGAADTPFTIVPGVTDWSTAGDDDLAASTIEITGVANPTSGAVSKSGRTSGLTEGDTNAPIFQDENGNIVEGELLDGWAQVEGRWVHGFASGVDSYQGDSGGAVFQGGNAVGLVSGGPAAEPGEDTWTWATRLQDALTNTDHGGWEIAIHIDAPEITNPDEGGTVAPGAALTGVAPSNATDVSYSFGEGSGDVVSVGDGNQFQIPAPEAEGDYTVTFRAENGQSFSESVEFGFTVEIPPIEAPTFDDTTVTAPAGQTSGSVTLTGTGEPGAEVVIDGEDDLSVIVGDDGTWEIVYEGLDIGTYELGATQTLDGETSARSTASIVVNPAAAEITSPADGTSIPNDDAPSTISGTGIPGATVTVTDESADSGVPAGLGIPADLDEVEVGEDGTWSVDLGSVLINGDYTVSATQEFNGLTSASTTSSFTVEAAAEAPGEEEPGDELPATGMDVDLLPYGIAGIALLLVGGATLALTYRNGRLQL